MTLDAGDLLANKYRIEAEIGRGAFGRVYRARDIALDRVVAIKELHKGEDDIGSTVFSDYVRRFEREARVQARFNHPNIVHVYELLRLADDRLYLAMEYVDGESLRDYIARRGPLPVDEALRIMADLLAGLAAVHADERDIVHRDIKPSNVMLTRVGQAKLTDFGLAQVGDESLRSGAGQPHPGSPMYMSPEQETTNAYLYPASDVFSAGCVLFELLTGVVYKQAKRRKRELADLRPDTPPWLVEVVARALARDADERPTDAGELGQLLDQAARAATHSARQQQGIAGHARQENEAVRQQPVWQRIGIELIRIPAGEFLYGDDKRKVTPPEYRIASTPVTNVQYKAFVDATGYRASDHWQDGQIPKGKENHPMVYISWTMH